MFIQNCTFVSSIPRQENADAQPTNQGGIGTPGKTALVTHAERYLAAGVTLLAIGNGAPDVFASVAAFASSDRTGSIGFGSVLGGALFITTVVSGTVALVTCKGRKEPKFAIFRRKKPEILDEECAPRTVNDSAVDGQLQNGSVLEDIPYSSTLLTAQEAQAAAEGFVRLDLICFIRDVFFLLVSVGVLTLVLMDGKVYLWEAICYLSVYVIYAAFVWTAELLHSRRNRRRSSLLEPLIIKAAIESARPQWADAYETHEHTHYHVHSQEIEAEVERIWEDPNDHSLGGKLKHWLLVFYKYCIEWPLALPRRLTIPVIEEERWSRKLAIASCTLAPIFVVAVWALYYANNVNSTLLALGLGAILGVILGSLAFCFTDEEQPPQQFLTLWLAGGFFMSIVWFYVVANELVESLQSLGSIFGISTSILALTVLAWGNSVGDLVADLALACSGPDGVQIAISGCYAGPLFNTVVGLGLSLILGCWNSEPNPYLIADKDGSLFYINGFLAIGLIWALVILPLQGMRLGRALGIGLIVLYCIFFMVGIFYTMGWLT
ncbi:hypothetical protein GOP47_0017356 [Adiantum capillus-veneris]|uniref:Sodium/calcium exchanger membrane region domain-containing protein n=1 Tax=Adiantum capillus-veneris TaxID=13818 RepID=A0A9D4UG24_ADICA|nr:hypothetical protein GOP47_0017356 [Adiantum capillus-veneris]